MQLAPAPRLTPFPPARPCHLALPASLRGRGFGLRAATAADLPWLRLLYAGTREEELAPLPWPPEARRAFCDQQFTLQHEHYLRHYPDTEFLILALEAQPVGRLYLHHGRLEDVVVDISLLPAWRGQGLGTALLAAAQAQAATRGAALLLQVSRHNPRARALYERLGFEVGATAASATHVTMQWRASTAS